MTGTNCALKKRPDKMASKCVSLNYCGKPFVYIHNVSHIKVWMLCISLRMIETYRF